MLHTMKRFLSLIAILLGTFAYASEPVSVVSESASSFFDSPLGDAVVPMIIMLLCYALYRLVKGEVREEQELA